LSGWGALTRPPPGAASQPFRDMAGRAASSLSDSAQRGRAGAWRATGGSSPVAGAPSPAASGAEATGGQGTAPPAWARQLQSAQSAHVRRHAVLQTIKDGDRPGGSANPDLSSKED
jgi:type IV secretion system protein TrbL